MLLVTVRQANTGLKLCHRSLRYLASARWLHHFFLMASFRVSAFKRSSAYILLSRAFPVSSSLIRFEAQFDHLCCANGPSTQLATAAVHILPCAIPDLGQHTTTLQIADDRADAFGIGTLVVIPFQAVEGQKASLATTAGISTVDNCWQRMHFKLKNV